jgi:DNA-binding SARP family transcriptional activator/streptogramin lyase
LGIDGAHVLTSAFRCYRLELPEGTWVDVVVATDATRKSEEALAVGDLETAKASAELATSIVEKPLLPGEEGTWVEGKRGELAELRGRALTVLADASLRSADPARAAIWAEQAILLAPFHETGYRRLMEAHVAAGNRAEALRVYERCRRLLAQELGTYPSPEIESIYRELLEAPSMARAPEVSAPLRAEAGPTGGVDRAEPPRSARGGVRSAVRRTRVAAAAAALLAAGVTAGTLALATARGEAPKVLPNSVVRIDPRTLEVKQVVPVGDAPDLVVAAGGYVWVTSHVLRDVDTNALRDAGDRTLTRVDPSTGEAVVVGGGLAPCGLTGDPSGDVWVADCYPPSTGSRDNVARVDAATLDFEKTYPVPEGDGYYRGLAFGDGSLWVSKVAGGDVPNEDIVVRVDPSTGTKKTIHLPRPVTAALAWSEAYGDLWITNFGGGSLTRLHPESGAVETVDDVAINPDFPVVDGDYVWAGDWARPTVERLRAVGMPRERTISLPAKNRSAGVEGITAGAGDIWATTPRDHALWRIDPATSRVTRIDIPYLPMGVAVDGDDVWVTVRQA